MTEEETLVMHPWPRVIRKPVQLKAAVIASHTVPKMMKFYFLSVLQVGAKVKV